MKSLIKERGPKTKAMKRKEGEEKLGIRGVSWAEEIYADSEACFWKRQTLSINSGNMSLSTQIKPLL